MKHRLLVFAVMLFVSITAISQGIASGNTSGIASHISDYKGTWLNHSKTVRMTIRLEGLDYVVSMAEVKDADGEFYTKLYWDNEERCAYFIHFERRHRVYLRLYHDYFTNNRYINFPGLGNFFYKR